MHAVTHTRPTHARRKETTHKSTQDSKLLNMTDSRLKNSKKKMIIDNNWPGADLFAFRIS